MVVHCGESSNKQAMARSLNNIKYNDINTLPKTNIAPTNGWLEYYFPIGEAYFQGLR